MLYIFTCAFTYIITNAQTYTCSLKLIISKWKEMQKLRKCRTKGTGATGDTVLVIAAVILEWDLKGRDKKKGYDAMRMVPPNRKTSKFQGIMQQSDWRAQRTLWRPRSWAQLGGRVSDVRWKLPVASHHASHPRSVKGHWILFTVLFLVLILGFYILKPSNVPTKYIVSTEPHSSPKVCIF